jgi:DNA mismatch endonuclease (patch repair protein)
VSDIVSPEKRSSMMAAVRRQHTKPELNLRRALHRSGLRFRLHRHDLPGTPDVVLITARVAILLMAAFGIDTKVAENQQLRPLEPVFGSISSKRT